MFITCKFAFDSPEEKNEWQNLEKSLDNIKDFPIELLIENPENVSRLERHGYKVSLSAAPNVYEISKKKDILS